MQDNVEAFLAIRCQLRQPVIGQFRATAPLLFVVILGLHRFVFLV
jgi:hypothetical protein